MGSITEFFDRSLDAKSVEEIAEIAAGEGIELAEGEAEKLFERFHGAEGDEIIDEELDDVAGGGCAPRTVRPGIDECGFALESKCRASCHDYYPCGDDPSVGGCYRV